MEQELPLIFLYSMEVIYTNDANVTNSPFLEVDLIDIKQLRSQHHIKSLQNYYNYEASGSEKC